MSIVAAAVLASCASSSPPNPAPPTATDPQVVEAERQVARTPTDAAAHDALGEALLATGELDRAERAFEKALALDAKLAVAYHGIAMVRFHRGDPAGGLEQLTTGLALTPEIDETYTRTRLLESIAWAHALAGDQSAAGAAIDASVAAQGLDAAIATRVAHVGRAKLLLHASKWSDALAEAAAARAGDGVPPYVMRAAATVAVLAHAGAGDPAAAATALAPIARDEHPGVVEARVALAIASGELDAAAALLPALEPLDPYAAEQATLAVARALRKAGRVSDARPRFAAIAARYLRSVPSAHARRAAANELGAK
jgi:tetratricopeptide (TPR) repeat protein